MNTLIGYTRKVKVEQSDTDRNIDIRTVCGAHSLSRVHITPTRHSVIRTVRLLTF